MDLVEVQLFTTDCLVQGLLDCPSGSQELDLLTLVLDVREGHQLGGVQELLQEPVCVALREVAFDPGVSDQVHSDAQDLHYYNTRPRPQIHLNL